MATPNSLSSYFKDTDPVTLDNCDREKIHLSNAIQPIGTLLVFDPDSFKIVAASNNASRFFNIDSSDIFTLSAADISTELADQLAELGGDQHVLHEILEFEWQYQGTCYDAITHFHDNRRIVEFLPNNNPSAKDVRRKMRLCSKSCARILHSATFNDAMQIATDAVRSITGFSRVKIYQFLPDWSGETVAESRDGKLESYLGLHFPATDIPQQVRQIMLIVPYRAIGTTSDDVVPITTAQTTDAELDLTWSLLRSVSTMHTAYTRNMGVNATFSCSLLHKESLWGLIACHHNEPLLLPFDSWILVQEISLALMLRYEQKQRTDVADMIHRLRIIENQFAAEVRRNGDVEDVINMLIPTLQEFLGADGFAFQYGSNLHMSGSTPPKAFVSDLISWAISQRDALDQFQSIQLHKDWEPAKEHIDTACGVLVQPITIHRVCQLIWFRGPTTQSVHWAGEPVAKSSGNDTSSIQSLEPRSSFKRWVNEHRDKSTPWQEAELESAREIFKEFLDIIASQVLLKEENASLRSFTASAAHDIRAPLRGITMALEAMGEEITNTGTVLETHGIAQRSAKRLNDLTAALLDLALITEQQHTLEPIDLNTIVVSANQMLDTDIKSANATVKVETLPTVNANAGLLSRLFLNLVSNALKYAHPKRTPVIKIHNIDSKSHEVKIAISDNGLGIAQKQAATVFKPLQRLHTAEQVEGTGLGLTICRKIMDVHNGTIELDTEYAEGSRFVITFPDRHERE